MSTHADTTQDNKSQSSVNGGFQKQNSIGARSQFVDHRQNTLAQRKLQEVVNQSPQVKHLRLSQERVNKSPQTKQAAQLQAMADGYSGQQQAIQQKRNKTGLSDDLKTGIEHLSGYAMDDVKVHFNSDKPAQLNARAYAQGTDIHIASGQEQHLAHEAWHVVQQKQGRVKPTNQLKEISLNDDLVLEKEADVMGAKATQLKKSEGGALQNKPIDHGKGPIQRLLGFEFESNFPAANLAGALDQGGKAGETTAETDLRKYLSGQAYANTSIHTFPGEDYNAVSDHSPVSSAIEAARTYVNFYMGNATLPLWTPNKQYIDPGIAPVDPKPGIVEYTTTAFDVSTLQGITDMATCMANLANHMNGVHGQITGAGVVAPPLSSPGFFVGIPPVAAWHALANRYGIATGDMDTQRNKILATVDQQIYPQITVGVLPKNIPELFQTANAEGLTQGQDPNLAFSTRTSQVRILDAQKVAEKALSKVGGGVTYDADTIGYVTFLAQYVLGSFADSINQFEITKNLPIFLSKTSLTGAQATISNLASRPLSWGFRERRKLRDKLWEYGAKRFNHSRPATRVDSSTEGSFSRADALTILAGGAAGGDPFTSVIMNRTIGLDPHRDVKTGVLSLNKEITMEFRALSNIAQPNDLGNWADNILRMMVKVNAR